MRSTIDIYIITLICVALLGVKMINAHGSITVLLRATVNATNIADGSELS